MPYYFFEKCNKEALKGIEALAIELGLEEQKHEKSVRQWVGKEVFKRSEDFDRKLTIDYSPMMIHPLLVETSPNVTLRQEDVKSLMRRVMKICRVNRIYFDENQTYNIKEFSCQKL